MLLDVRTGYAGRGGAGAEGPEPEPLCACDRESADPRLSTGGFSCNFSLMPDDGGAAGARCDLRLLCSSILTAQASRSTGVRFAA